MSDGTNHEHSVETTIDTRVFDATRSAFVADPTRTNDFTYDERLNAGYGMVSAQTGRLQLQGGVRVERAGAQFRLRGAASGVPGTYENGYSSVFPSGLVAYRLDDERRLKLSYSTRIRRPDEPDQLDPTLRTQDPLNLSRGNPYLQPEYVRAVELGLQQETDRVTMQLTPFFRHTVDAVRRLRTVDGQGVTTSTFANVAATLSARTFGWTARTNAAYRVSKTFDVQALVTYRAATTVEQGRSLSQTRVNLAARRKLADDRVNLVLRVLDPFDTERERSITNDPRFQQQSSRRRRVRGLLLNVTWSFGAASDDEERTPRDPGADPGVP